MGFSSPAGYPSTLLRTLEKLGVFSSSKYTKESRSAEFWTSFERASALILSSLLIWTRSISASYVRYVWTKAWYFASCGSLAMYSPLVCFPTIWESL